MSSICVKPAQAGWKSWLDQLCCPACKQPLGDDLQCIGCGEVFGMQGAVPRLIPSGARARFTCEFTSDRSVVGEDELRSVVQYPPRSTSDGLPYHMDRAHAHRLEQLPAGSTVLEIGCGGGQSRRWLEHLGHRYIGTDITPHRVTAELQAFGGPDLLADAHFLPFRGETFDAVYCAAVFEHLACQQLAAREVARVLKPGGVFMGNCSFLEPWHDASFSHLSILGAMELLKMAGLQPEHVWPGMGYTVFDSVASMAMRGPFRHAARGLSRPLLALTALQGRVARWRARFRQQPATSDILRLAEVSGATDWIATKPMHATA